MIVPISIRTRNLLKAKRRMNGNSGIIMMGKRMIGENAPTFIVAEGANNHLCDVETAKKMIDAACAAGADAIKFQTFKAEHLVTEDAPIFWKMPGVNTQFEFYKSIDKFGKEEFRTLFAYARKKGMICFSTPFDCESATMLNELGVGIFKIASCDVPDLRLHPPRCPLRQADDYLDGSFGIGGDTASSGYSLCGR